MESVVGEGARAVRDGRGACGRDEVCVVRGARALPLRPVAGGKGSGWTPR